MLWTYVAQFFFRGWGCKSKCETNGPLDRRTWVSHLQMTLLVGSCWDNSILWIHIRMSSMSNELIFRSFNELGTNRLTDQQINHLTDQSTNRPIDQPTDWLTDELTNRHMDGWADWASYRDARMHLKKTSLRCLEKQGQVGQRCVIDCSDFH